jgi:hypothetical protein
LATFAGESLLADREQRLVALVPALDPVSRVARTGRGALASERTHHIVHRQLNGFRADKIEADRALDLAVEHNTRR